MKRIIVACTAIGLAVPTVVPMPALAQSPDYLTNDRCWNAVVHEARGRFAVHDILQVSSGIRPGRFTENILTGRGEANGRPFRYTCTYNFRTGQTYAVSVNPEPAGPPPLPRGSWIESCASPEMRGPVLIAQCKDVYGNWVGTQIDVRACRSGRLANNNGNLVCG